MGSRSERDKKWSQKAAAAEQLVQRAISFHSMADDVLAIKDRWAEPTSAAIKLTEDVIVAPLRSSHTFPALEFGHRAELSLIKCWRDHKQVSEIGDNKSHNLYVACFGDGGAVDGRVAWVVVNKYRYTVYLRKGRLVRESEHATPRFVFDVPSDIQPAMMVLAHYFEPDKALLDIKIMPLDATMILDSETDDLLDTIKRTQQAMPAGNKRRRAKSPGPAIGDDNDLRRALQEIRSGDDNAPEPIDDVNAEEVSALDRQRSEKVIESLTDAEFEKRYQKALEKLYPHGFSKQSTSSTVALRCPRPYENENP